MAAFSDIDIIIPTLNASKVLETCLYSITYQNYPKNRIHLYLADGGSIDNTLKIAQKYRCQIVHNPLKTAEAGKAVGFKNSSSKLISFIDSDNILPSKNWLLEMSKPLKDLQIVGSEPIAFTYRPHAGFIERYSALIGANDPYAFFTGVYDRFSYLTQKWTNLKLDTINQKDFLKIKIDDNQNIPTIGANGTIFRRSFLKEFFHGNYLFDIDLLTMAPKPIYFAKVKNSIIHTYCENSISKFIRKQQRRIKDLYQYQSIRHYHWQNNQFKKNILFALYSVLIIPALLDSVRGYFHKPDLAWFFHPLACLITFYIYTFYFLLHTLGINSIQSRSSWSQ
jgi:glycosyltransferase involved in cell wall biosynthesis